MEQFNLKKKAQKEQRSDCMALVKKALRTRIA